MSWVGGSKARGLLRSAARRELLNLLDDRGRRVTLLDRLQYHRAAARLDGVAADDLIRGPVGSLDQNVGLDATDDIRRRLVVEDRHRVDAGECLEHFAAFPLGIDRARRTFVAPHRGVGIETDDQYVAMTPR